MIGFSYLSLFNIRYRGISFRFGWLFGEQKREQVKEVR